MSPDGLSANQYTTSTTLLMGIGDVGLNEFALTGISGCSDVTWKFVTTDLRGDYICPDQAMRLSADAATSLW